MVSSGGATSTPLVVGSGHFGESGAYAQMLARELPREKPVGNGMRLASFFCCAGGIDLGFRSAGFEPAFANDYDKDAVAAYAANLGHAPVHRDIRQVTAEDWGGASYDVVTGGFPCVTFSTAGQRVGVVDNINGTLYLELCRVIREIKPKYFVAENVRGLLSANGGKAIKFILAAFLRLGYRTDYQLVNMAEHGVPQTRERVIFVGVRLDQWRGTFRFSPKTRRLADDKKAAKFLPIARTLREAIGDLPAPGERRDHEKNKYDDACISGAMMGRQGGNVHPFLSSHAGELRRMTVRECARVQTFPDWFEFSESQAVGYKLVGNAVPPLYAKRLAEAILEYDAREVIP